MGLRDKLTQARDSIRELRLSLRPDSYFQYKRGRESERKRAEEEREQALGSAERSRGDAERVHDYEERYEGEREHHAGGERSERADDAPTDR